jgi:hypothetical protein
MLWSCWRRRIFSRLVHRDQRESVPNIRPADRSASHLPSRKSRGRHEMDTIREPSPTLPSARPNRIDARRSRNRPIPRSRRPDLSASKSPHSISRRNRGGKTTESPRLHKAQMSLMYIKRPALPSGASKPGRFTYFEDRFEWRG